MKESALCHKVDIRKRWLCANAFIRKTGIFFRPLIFVEILLRVRGYVVFCRCVIYLPMMYVYQLCPY